jgi:glycosyltransferase involved in cell wall biosynthesis
MKSEKYRVFVFANLKPSQIHYKIIPLSKSSMVEHVFILRKSPLRINEEKITCLGLPWILRQRPIYWFLTAFYGVMLMRRYHTNIILNYNIFPHGFNAWLASKITRQRVIFSEINEDTINYFQKYISHSIVNKILSNARIICTPGLITASFWNKAGFNNTYTLHSTIDTFQFKPDPECKKIYDFIYIGVLDKNKQPDLIINAFEQIHRKISDATLCIIGFGELESELKQLILKLNLSDSVTFLRTNDVLNYLQKSKIFVMASLSEGLPCAMMEAMSTELIVVVSPVGDIPGVIENGSNGFLHDNTNDGLVQYMGKALQEYDSNKEIRVNARKKIVDEHSFLVATSKWDYLLNSI